MIGFLRFALIGLIMAILDLPWLWVSMDCWKEAIQRIQGGSRAVFRGVWAIPTYFALGYLANAPRSGKDAFWTGLATYAVFDGTNFALFKGYPTDLAVADTLWGGILFWVTHHVIKRFL